MTNSPHTSTPVFNAPIRWAVRVLAWLAFAVAAYLTWFAINNTSVAGCGMGNANGCDEVLTSSWSKWLGIPVALVGLACYSSLAGLSVLLGMTHPVFSRWVNTLFVMLAIVAAGGSLWFIAIQAIAIGTFCPYCLVADTCGLALGALSIWSAVHWWQNTRHLRRFSGSSPGLMTLRSALPTSSRAAPVVAQRTAPVVAQRQAPPPLLPIAFGGASALLLLLIGGQLVFPAKAYEVQKGALPEPIALNGANAGAANSPNASADTQPHVAMRVPTEGENGDNEDTTSTAADSEPATDSAEQAPAEPDKSEKSAEGNGTSSASATAPERTRNVKFLSDKLTLNVYDHPLIGSPEAKHVVVEMLSYNCVHCRKMHSIIKRAASRYGEQVAIIVIPIPMEQSCNKLVTDPASNPGACTTARMSLGVARLKPYAFPRFHDWLMADKDEPPRLDAIIAKSYGLVDRNRLRELRTSDKLDKQIAQYVDLYANLQKQHTGDKNFGLPVQILGDHLVTGSVEKADEVFKAWEEHLGVKPR